MRCKAPKLCVTGLFTHRGYAGYAVYQIGLQPERYAQFALKFMEMHCIKKANVVEGLLYINYIEDEV
jgi:hypothetical protein